jgi:hypothetical protein
LLVEIVRAVKLGNIVSNDHAFFVLPHGPLPMRSRAFTAPAPCVLK